MATDQELAEARERWSVSSWTTTTSSPWSRASAGSTSSTVLRIERAEIR